MQGTALTLEEMLNPIEEDVIDDGCNFPRGDNEIIEYVNQEINGDDNEDSEDEGKEEDVKEITKPREAQSRIQAPLDHFWNQPIAVDSDASSMA